MEIWGFIYIEILVDIIKNWKYGEEKYFNIEFKVSCVMLNVMVFSFKILIFKKFSLRLLV